MCQQEVNGAYGATLCPPRLRGCTVLRTQRRLSALCQLLGAPARPSEPPPCAALSHLPALRSGKQFSSTTIDRLACTVYCERSKLQ